MRAPAAARGYDREATPAPRTRALGKELRTSVLAPELFVEREAAELGRSRRAAQLVMAASRRLAAGVVAFVLHVHVHVLFTVHASSTAENGAKPVVIDAHVHMVSSTNGLDYLWAQTPSSLSPPRTCPCAPPCMCNWTQTEYSVASATLKPTHVIL